MRTPAALLAAILASLPSTPSFAEDAVNANPDAAALAKMASRYAPVDLRVDLSSLPASEKAALGHLVEAARVMDALFLRQVWAGNEALVQQLAADDTPLGRARLAYLLRNQGPWSRLDHDAPFLPWASVPVHKPEAANFYPAGITKAELEAWHKTLSDADRARATGFFTTIRRAEGGGFVIVPYSLEYQGELALAAGHLRAAAAATSNATLRAFLDKRAAAFLSNDYYDSDVAWMEIDAAVEPTIGPYEVYEDGWENAKAAFEAFITVRDDAETKKLARFSGELQDIENHLPYRDADKGLRNGKLGALAPIRVVNEIFCSGDANHGVQTAAYNLPNDERVTEKKGTKRVMLKNVQEAKFERVLKPIAKVALPASDQGAVSFEAFFTHILLHELMHGLGPHNITVGGKPSTVRAQLGADYSAMEEAKADISGLWALQFLVDKRVLGPEMERTMYTTFLASAFRSIRFGLNEAHGRGVALQMNWLLDKGGFSVDKEGRFKVEPRKIKDAVKSLVTELITLQAHGDKARADELIAKMVVIRPEVKRVLDQLGDVPVDIAPRFVTADELTR